MNAEDWYRSAMEDAGSRPPPTIGDLKAHPFSPNGRRGDTLPDMCSPTVLPPQSPVTFVPACRSAGAKAEHDLIERH